MIHFSYLDSLQGLLYFENKENRFSEPFYPTDDKEADFKFMKAYFKNVKGKVPEYS